MYYRRGFTIVELLVVIVVIGILSTITIVSYSGITSRAINASLQSDLSNATTQLKMYQAENGFFPNSVTDCPSPAAGNACLKLSSDNIFSGYAYSNSPNPQNFHLTASNGDTSYRATNDLAPSENASVGILTSGLVAHYPLDGNPSDFGSGANNGTVYNSIVTNGSVNQAYSFNGSDAYIYANNATVSTINSTYSFSFWIKSSVFSGAQATILSKREGCNNEGMFSMTAGNNRLYFKYYTGASTNISSNSILSDGKLYHVVWVKPFNQYGTKLYVNGVERTVNNDTNLQGIAANLNPIIIGAQWSGSICESLPADPSEMRLFFNGIIDDVRIYDRALTANEVEILYSM